MAFLKHWTVHDIHCFIKHILYVLDAGMGGGVIIIIPFCGSNINQLFGSGNKMLNCSFLLGKWNLLFAWLYLTKCSGSLIFFTRTANVESCEQSATSIVKHVVSESSTVKLSIVKTELLLTAHRPENSFYSFVHNLFFFYKHCNRFV